MTKNRRIGLKLALVLASVCVALLACEIALHILYPYRTFRAGYELPWMRFNQDANLAKVFTVDPELGFRPVLGSALYNDQGTLVNGYALAKQPGRTRVLFLGDSIAQRGRIVAELRALYGEQGYEYWNAGVESYNTVQEVRFYQRYNRPIHPDRVVLLFCSNDFETTPIAYFNAENRLVVISPARSSRQLSPWLFQHSMLYRIWLGVSGQLGRRDESGAIAAEVRDSLRDLSAELAAQHIAFSVLFVPYLDDQARWPGKARRALESIGAICRELGIDSLDLYPALAGTMTDWRAAREAANDLIHPGEQAARLMAVYARARHILDK
jgi:hypothetical protein